MGLNFETEFDTSAWQAGLNALTKKRMKLAMGGALQKTASFAGKKVKRDIATRLKLPQKALENRIHVRTFKKDGVLRVWIGTEHLFPYSVGVPSVYGKTRKSGGVKVRRLRWPGAFMPKKAFNPGSVWIRMSSAKYTPELYPGKGFTARGKYDDPRFPIVQAVIEIEDLVEEAFGPLRDEIVQKFETLLSAEIDKQIMMKKEAGREQAAFRARFEEAVGK
ncbi:hypothetical protein DGMP_06590 [Desulfomarina profundi]|uniref:Uncharacterized protein n=1 Tax=Desulfomarina profundi TaxID=2772557 RepID=A0A8D5FRB3_9BACT|nr:hypothetical protein [Desulfomarina profundi]BCL59966.1 hypothetical protein DGMP_06590 [Desulfomarina profundi]